MWIIKEHSPSTALLLFPLVNCWVGQLASQPRKCLSCIAEPVNCWLWDLGLTGQAVKNYGDIVKFSQGECNEVDILSIIIKNFRINVDANILLNMSPRVY